MLGSKFVNRLTHINKSRPLHLKHILLQLTLYILNQQLVSNIPQLLLKLSLLVIVHNRYQDLIDKSQTVTTHEDILSIVNRLSKWLQEGCMPTLLFE